MSDNTNTLPPLLAAKLAEAVYGLVSPESSLKDNIGLLSKNFSLNLITNDSSLLTATSGLGFIQARTAFGITAFGALYTKPCKESLLCA